LSVEKMEMMNVIGHIGDLDKVSTEIIRSGCVQIVNALNEINQNDFTVLMPGQNVNMLTDLCFIKPYKGLSLPSEINEKIVELTSIFDIPRVIRSKYIEEDYKLEDMVSKVEQIYDEVTKHNKDLKTLKDEVDKIKFLIEDFKCIKGLQIDMQELRNMKYFEFKVGKLTKENFDKLNENIENVSSIIYELRSTPVYHVFMSLTPKPLVAEVDRIFKSLNYEEVDIPYDLKGKPIEIIDKLTEIEREKEKQMQDINDVILQLRAKYAPFIDESYTRMKMHEKLRAVNSEVVCSNDFFYMAGWVPETCKQKVKKKLSCFGDGLMVVFKPQSDVKTSIVPPTKLNNNWFVRPFESIVRMYGIPLYNETDPTWFVALSYMFMFGYMFGDLGQGFVFLIVGIFLSAKLHHPNLGGVLSRIGASSMVFGILFGSVFGNEEILKHPLVRPMDNINAVLLGGVVVGVLFITVGFVFNLVNSVKRRDLEEGAFGKNGLAGLAFYWLLLLSACSMFLNGAMPVPLPVIVIILSLLLVLMVVKQPLANLIKGGRPLYEEAPGDYYIESGFGAIETLISMLSNTVSFIRVGAFALNHVGLFVAFATIAGMMKNNAASVAVIVIGNIVIIALEGLVVFIQGLRLEYYELFSKYYTGGGIEYNPAKAAISYDALDFTKNRRAD
jgi:V/A-type H+-transporting ATPase subunit I